MKFLVTLFLFMMSFIVSHAQNNTNGVTVKATVTNVQNNKGKVIFALHTKDTFLKGKGIKNATVTIENGVATATFTNVAPGNYAILVLHDKNENNQMDYTVNGMPAEDFGATNNVMNFGPPHFTDAEFNVNETDLAFTIRF